MSCFVKHSSAIEGEETKSKRTLRGPHRSSWISPNFCGERFESSVNGLSHLSEKMEVANDGNTWWALGEDSCICVMYWLSRALMTTRVKMIKAKVYHNGASIFDRSMVKHDILLLFPYLNLVVPVFIRFT